MNGEITTAAATNTTLDPDILQDTYVFLFSPILLSLIILTITSNSLNITMLAQTVGRSTSLNILLLNISCFNLPMVFNELVLLVLVLRKGEPIPPQMCHLATILNTMSTNGISVIHLILSWDRYVASKTPLSWISHRRKAWINTTLLWIGVSLFAVYNLIFNYKDINGDIPTCFWPAVSTCKFGYSLALNLLSLVGLLVTASLVYFFHTKTSLLLTKNEKRKQRYLQETFHITADKPPKTVPERAILSLQVVFGIHLASQLPSNLFNVIHHAIVESDQNIPILIPIALTCISCITGCSPLFLLINRRYKQNVKNVFQCVCKNEDKELEKRIDAQSRLSALTRAKSKNVPNNPSVFLSGSGGLATNNPSVFCSISGGRANKYVAKARRSNKPKTNRTKPSVALEAVNTGLVLAAAGHGAQIDNFFKETTHRQETALRFDDTSPGELLFL